MEGVVQVLFDIGKAIDKGEPALAIFFDFAKAFDLVPHDRLLKKLALHLPPWWIRWLANYFKDRRQSVKSAGIFTEWKKVEAGVIKKVEVGKFKVMYFAAKKNEQPPILTLSNVQLEMVSSY